MAYKSTDYNAKLSLAKLLSIFIVLSLLYLFFLWQRDRVSFWLLFWQGVIFIAIVGIAVILLGEYRTAQHKKLIDSFETAGGHEKILNFINSFGLQRKSGYGVWQHGDYSFTFEQIANFITILKDNGITVDKKDVYFLLIHYIRQKDFQFMQDSVLHTSKKFSDLSSSDFEVLLVRLYEAIGYSVMKTGKTGDQGCDLVVNMGRQRTVIQAKCYTGSVPNSAVQQAVAALKIYNCEKAICVTNSYFTPEAIQLAKANTVDLIDGHRLRELLLQHLKENWS